MRMLQTFVSHPFILPVERSLGLIGFDCSHIVRHTEHQLFHLVVTMMKIMEKMMLLMLMLMLTSERVSAVQS